MRQGLPYSKLNTNSWLKWITFDLICFIVVSALTFGFCYSYFSDKVEAGGSTTTASVLVEYRQNSSSTTASSTVYAMLDGENTIEINSENVSTNKIIPGQTIQIKGYAFNISNIPVYIMGKLVIEVSNSKGEAKLSETIWYNIQTGATCSDTLTIGASSLEASQWITNADKSVTINTPDTAKKALSLDYTFSGDIVNGDIVTKLEFTLLAHQKDYLSTANDFNNFSSVNSYSQEQVYAAHCITGLSLTNA